MTRPVTLQRVVAVRPRLPVTLRARPYASTASRSNSYDGNIAHWRSVLKLAALGASATLFCYYYKNPRAHIHTFLARTIAPLVDPETLHSIAITTGRYGLWPVDAAEDDGQDLQVVIGGKIVKNPIGLAAGFDKDASAVDSLFSLGFGAVEVGSVTLRPQEGNPRPRVFRLLPDRAIINRYGFPSVGLSQFRSNLYRARPSPPRALLGVNLGRNKTTDTEIDDFVACARLTKEKADYVVINVSSPNTPGLRDVLDDMKRLQGILKAVRGEVGKEKMVWLKVSPDLSEQGLEKIADVAVAENVDALVVSNTTVSRPASLQSDQSVTSQRGGLSGPPLKPLSLSCVKLLHQRTRGKVPIIGCGGIATASDVIEYAQAGATMVQLYTALTTEGLGLVARVKADLKDILRERGMSWNDLIGAGAA